jgi:predicted O-methyltransferase YrrM
MADNFLFLENDFIAKQYGHLQFVTSFKYEAGFKIGLNLLHQEKKQFPIVVETGTQRMKDDPGGCSTTLFGAYLKKFGGHLWTCDISKENIEISRKCTEDFKDFISYVIADSTSFLNVFGEISGGCQEIDLLFLDSMDCPANGDALPAQGHQLAEFMAAEKYLGKGAVLVMDDTNFTNGGKTRLLKNFIMDNRTEWKLICDYGETVFYKVA